MPDRLKTHVVQFNDFTSGWRTVKGPWGIGECCEYVMQGYPRKSCYPDRYRIINIEAITQLLTRN